MRFVFSLALAFTLAANVAAAAQPPLRWGADAEGGAPYIFKDPGDPNRNIGFEVDLAAALARELGRPVEFQQYAYENLISGVLRGDLDIAMNGLEVTPDREKRVRFSRPYYVYQLQLVTRAGDGRFASLDDCRKKNAAVGTLEETAAERLLDQLGITKRLYDGQVEPYRDLELGRLDAVLLDLPIAVYYARGNAKLQFVGEPLGAGHYAIALHPQNEALAEEIDAALERLYTRGELQRIYEKWSIWNDDQAGLAADREELTNILSDAGQRWTPAVYLPMLIQAAGVTIYLSVISMALAMALGLPIALCRMYGPRPLQWLAITYIEFFRGIPILLLLYFLYYGLPGVSEAYNLPFSLKFSPIVAAIIGFGLNYAAYEAEIYRAGILAVPAGQWEAAASLGMSRAVTFRRIILPQAVRIILPPVTNDFVALFKDTSIVSVIAVVELTKAYLILSKSSLKYLEIGLATAALYLLMSVPLGYLSRYLEDRWSQRKE